MPSPPPERSNERSSASRRLLSKLGGTLSWPGGEGEAGVEIYGGGDSRPGGGLPGSGEDGGASGIRSTSRSKLTWSAALASLGGARGGAPQKVPPRAAPAGTVVGRRSGLRTGRLAMPGAVLCHPEALAARCTGLLPTWLLAWLTVRAALGYGDARGERESAPS